MELSFPSSNKASFMSQPAAFKSALSWAEGILVYSLSGFGGMLGEGNLPAEQLAVTKINRIRIFPTRSSLLKVAANSSCIILLKLKKILIYLKRCPYY